MARRRVGCCHKIQNLVATPNPSRNENLDRACRKPLPLHLLQRLTLSLGDALLRDRVRRAEFLGEEAHAQLLKTGVMISVLTLRHSDVQHPYQTGEPANLDLQLYYEES